MTLTWCAACAFFIITSTVSRTRLPLNVSPGARYIFWTRRAPTGLGLGLGQDWTGLDRTGPLAISFIRNNNKNNTRSHNSHMFSLSTADLCCFRHVIACVTLSPARYVIRHSVQDKVFWRTENKCIAHCEIHIARTTGLIVCHESCSACKELVC